MTRRTKTAAQRVRELHAEHPGLGPSELARRARTSKQVAASAIKASPRRGRPLGTDMRVTVRLPRALVEQARQIADRDGYSLADWLHGCVIAGVRDDQAQQEIRDATRRAIAGDASAEA